MYPYKVEYLESHIQNKTEGWNRKGNIDGFHTSKDLEALIIERSKEGYEVFNVATVTGTAVKPPYTLVTTIGFMVTFKKVVD